MKLKPTEFKKILKECILELIEEGKLPIFDSKESSEINENQSVRQNLKEEREEREDDSENISVTPNTRLNEAVRIATNQVSKGNPKTAAMYHNIFTDTAKTTLQKQLAKEIGQDGQVLSEHSILPEEKEFDAKQLGLFQAKNRWAQLAFGKKIN